jgi:hypothetical protein
VDRLAEEFLKVVTREFGESVARGDDELADAWAKAAILIHDQNQEPSQA